MKIHFILFTCLLTTNALCQGVESILNHYFEATGGKVAWESITSKIIKTHIWTYPPSESALNNERYLSPQGLTETEQILFIKMGQKLRDSSFSVKKDGSTYYADYFLRQDKAWIRIGHKTFPLIDKMQKVLSAISRFTIGTPEEYFAYDTSHFKFLENPITKSDSCYLVAFSHFDEIVQKERQHILWFNHKTGLLEKKETLDENTYTVYENHIAFGKFTLPQTIKTFKANHLISEYRISSFVTNVEIDERLFSHK